MPKKACSYPFQIGPATKRALMPCILSNHIYTKCDSPRVWCCWLQAVGLLKDEVIPEPPVPPEPQYITVTVTLTPTNVVNPTTSTFTLTPR